MLPLIGKRRLGNDNAWVPWGINSLTLAGKCLSQIVPTLWKEITNKAFIRKL